ncbi:MAG: glycosyltransferase involved in cell wall biosynthesis [Planctomycetota bacterium]|jgi:glycosyltransferase involved in cell wall biosynthesis
MSTIAVSMIVRDEESVLADCLASLAGMVDEICILDTGSTDATVEIAKAAGAKVEHFVWDDDFAAARNRALEMVTSDYVLVVDADERLATPDARERLLKFAAEKPGRVGQVELVDEGEMGEGHSKLVRFFPRANARWRRRVHEQVTLGGKVPVSAPCGVELRHLGYRKDFIAGKNKLERNIKLLQRALEEHPDDPYEWFQLGRTYFVGEQLEEAIDAFAMAFDHVEPDAPYLALLLELNAHALRASKRSAEALVLLEQVSGAFRDRSDTVYVEGLLSMDVGELERAEGLLQLCMTLPDNGGRGGASQEMTRTWGPAYHLAVMREVLGMKPEAEEYYNKVLEHMPGHAATEAALVRLSAV